jgi:GAF domain-containing protein
VAEEAPQAPVRARLSTGDDLISDLFETMHELHFMADMPSGAGFVLSVVQDTFSCKGGLVHVFDIDTSHFVVVRAFGPSAREVLLHRTSDREPWMVDMMRQGCARRVEVTPGDAGFSGGRWDALRLKPNQALCGPVHQSGRYLGAIELVDPQSGGPFNDAEVNALDYICEQFAEFLSQRPIVVDADLILQEQQ